MTDTERIAKQKELIELIGRNSERDVFQPVAARIMALLMVMDKEEYTFDEIVEEMKISKSSASTALRNLELRGVVEYVTYPGDRKRYFRFVSRDMKTILDEVRKKITEQLRVVDEILLLKKNAESRNIVMLKNVSSGMRWFLEKIDNIEIKP